MSKCHIIGNHLSQLNYDAFLSIRFDFIFVNSVNLDEMLHFILVFNGCLEVPADSAGFQNEKG